MSVRGGELVIRPLDAFESARDLRARTKHRHRDGSAVGGGGRRPGTLGDAQELYPSGSLFAENCAIRKSSRVT